MHMKSHQKYSSISFWMTLPVIIISTITGTANFAHGTFPENWSNTTPLIIGAFNLVAAIVTTVAQFMRVNERNEAHRAAALAYDKLCNMIQEELNLPANERTMSGLDMIEKVRTDYDRLLEQSPMIDRQIAMIFDDKFAKWFGDVHTTTLENSMAKPSLLDVREIRIFDPKSLPPPFLPSKISPKPPIAKPKPIDVSNFLEIAANEAAAATAEAARSAAEAEITKLRKSMTVKTFMEPFVISSNSAATTNESFARRLSDVVADAAGAVEVAAGAVAQVANDIAEDVGARPSPTADLSISLGGVQLDVDAVVHVDSSDLHADTRRESAEVPEASGTLGPNGPAAV